MNDIERQIMRAYIQLALLPAPAGWFRSVAVAQFGNLEVRLTELLRDGSHQATPPFCLEIYSHTSGSTLDSCSFFELDADELAICVELTCAARQSASNPPCVNIQRS